LTLGLAVDPSIRIRYGLEILGGWETWTEENRNDLLGSVETSAGGLTGYFHDWSVAAQGGVRWSNQNTESNLFARRVRCVFDRAGFPGRLDSGTTGCIS
jgi:hypothetical protein